MTGEVGKRSDEGHEVWKDRAGNRVEGVGGFRQDWQRGGGTAPVSSANYAAGRGDSAETTRGHGGTQLAFSWLAR